MPKSYKIDAASLPTGWQVGWILLSPNGRTRYEVIDLGNELGVTLRRLPLAERLENRLLMGNLPIEPTAEEE